MPTHSYNQFPGEHAKIARRDPGGEGFSLLDSAGKLVPEMARILSIIKKYDMVLANGHYLAA